MHGLGGQERMKGRWSSERSSTKEKRLEKEKGGEGEAEENAHSVGPTPGPPFLRFI